MALRTLASGYKHVVDQGTVIIDTSAARVATTPRPGEVVLLTPESSNSGLCYWGNEDVLTTTGVPMDNGITDIIPVSPDNLYIIGSAAGQVVRYMILAGPK